MGGPKAFLRIAYSIQKEERKRERFFFRMLYFQLNADPVKKETTLYLSVFCQQVRVFVFPFLPLVSPSEMIKIEFGRRKVATHFYLLEQFSSFPCLVMLQVTISFQSGCCVQSSSYPGLML